MNFCPKCGRLRNGTARFCGGCGHEFTTAAKETPASAPPVTDTAGMAGTAIAADVPGIQEPAEIPQATEHRAWDAHADAGRWDAAAPGSDWEGPADATRMDLTPEATRLDLPSRPPAQQPPAQQPPARESAPPQPDPFAGWFMSDTPTEQPTQTVIARPTSPSPGYQPPAQPTPPLSPAGGPPRPPYQPSPGRRSSGGRKALWIVVPVVVVLAAGGGAYALVKSHGGNTQAQSSTPPPTHASTAAASTPPASATASTSPTASASATASASVTATPTPSPSLVAIAPGVGSSTATPQVETLLSHYFQGINTHNYAEYSSTLTAQNKANQPLSNFQSGYATTTDSGMTLTSLTGTGGGDLTATVTFTSHQDAADSDDNSTCNNWSLNFSLVPNGTGYLIAPAPSGSATETAC